MSTNFLLLAQTVAFGSVIASLYFFMEGRKKYGWFFIAGIVLLPILVSFISALTTSCQELGRKSQLPIAFAEGEVQGMIPWVGMWMASPLRSNCLHQQASNHKTSMWKTTKS